MGVDLRQVVAGILTLTMFVMLGHMIKRDHFDSAQVSFSHSFIWFKMIILISLAHCAFTLTSLAFAFWIQLVLLIWCIVLNGNSLGLMLSHIYLIWSNLGGKKVLLKRHPSVPLSVLETSKLLLSSFSGKWGWNKHLRDWSAEPETWIAKTIMQEIN